MYFQITGTTQEDLHKQYEAEAESRTKTNLVVEAVAKAEGFEATEEEINAEIEQLAADYNMPVEQVRNLLSPEMLKHDITVKKAVNVITSTVKSKIIEIKKKSLEALLFLISWRILEFSFDEKGKFIVQ